MILKSILCFVATVAILGLAVLAFVKFHPVFGGAPDKASMSKIRASVAWNGAKFENAEPTKLATGDEMPSILGWLYDMIFTSSGKNPSAPLPSMKFDANVMRDGDFAWFGHSSVIFRVGGVSVITDPVFYRASPIFVGGAPFEYEITPAVSDLPNDLVVLISHDHYDHLDWRTVREMAPKVTRFIVPLGVRAYLLRWGVADEKITELDLEQTTQIAGVRFTLERARHFSGRFYKNTTLWGSYAIIGGGMKIFYGADSGDGAHFSEIGAKYDGFDIAMMENGAYNRNWAQIHSMPEQSAKNATKLGARVVLPIHWAKFDLAYHKWNEPIERLAKASESENFALATPMIGEIFNLSNLPRKTWWHGL